MKKPFLLLLALAGLLPLTSCRFHEVVTFDTKKPVPELNGNWLRAKPVKDTPDILRFSVYDFAPGEHIIVAFNPKGEHLTFHGITYTEADSTLVAYRMLEFDSKDSRSDVAKIELKGDTLRVFFLDDALLRESQKKQNPADTIATALRAHQEIFQQPVEYHREKDKEDTAKPDKPKK